MWSIGPGLMGKRFDHGMDEIQAAEILRAMALTEHPVFQIVRQEMVRAVGNLCRIFFPTDLVISGPFIENPGAWAAFAGALSRQGMLVDLSMPRLEAQPAGHQLEQEGASMPLLLRGLAQLLDEALVRPQARRGSRRASSTIAGHKPHWKAHTDAIRYRTVTL